MISMMILTFCIIVGIVSVSLAFILCVIVLVCDFYRWIITNCKDGVREISKLF